MWDEAKNLRAVADAAPHINAEVRIAGDGSPLGRLDEQRMAWAYAESAIYLFPALYEPFGLSILEAALAGWLSVRLDAQSVATFTNGQPADVVPAATAGRGFVRVHAAAGPLIGVGELTTGGSKVRPVRILHADRPGTRVLPA